MRAREAYREHPERSIDDEVYEWLLDTVEPPFEIVRQYKGWKRDGSPRAALIPDFLLVSRHVLTVIEVKAKRATAADGRQVLRYMDRARQTPGVRLVTGYLIAPSFSPRIPAVVSQIPWTA